MTRAIQVPLDPATLEALRRLATREERHPRIQAARLLRDALRAQGELTPDALPLQLAEARR
jgi:hypothetical protein